VHAAFLRRARAGLGVAPPTGMSAETATFPQAMRDPQAERRSRSLVVQTPTAGMAWFGGWLFTIGFAHLGFWKAVLGLVIWPYFLGELAR
jgi:hypothetical protein